MSDMIDKVGRAIWHAAWDHGDIGLYGDLERALAHAAIQAMRQDPETAPKGVPVLVDGGVAMKKTGGQWFSGMEEPLYQRPLTWEPTFWIPLDAFSAALESDGK